jgi:predicted transcriptional regulator
MEQKGLRISNSNKQFLKENIEGGLRELGKQTEAGHIIEANVIFKERKPVNVPSFVMLIQVFAEQFAALNLSGKTHRVFWYLISLLQYGNFISIDVNTIVENMGDVSKKSVMRAIKDLGELNIVKTVKYTNDKRRNEYFINPMAMWRGTWNERNKKIKKAQETNITLELPFSE